MLSNHVFVVPGCLEEPNDEVPIEGHHVVPKQKEVLVEGRHVVPKQQEILVEGHHVGPKQQEVLVEGRHVVPKQQEVLVEVHHVVPKQQEVLVEGRHAHQTHFHSCFFLTFPLIFHLYVVHERFILFLHLFFQSHQIRILSAGLGRA